MKKGRPANRRRKASAAARVRPYWIPIAIAAVLLAGGAAFVVAWPGFVPSRIDVVGNRVVPRAEILADAAVARRVNMWLQSPGSISARVEKIPYVAVAHVYRLPPSSVIISVKERVPFAVVRSGPRAVLVDRELRVLQPAPLDSTLPSFVLRAPDVELDPGSFVTAPGAVALRADYDAMIAAHVIPIRLAFDRFGGLVATVRGGVRVLLGDDGDMDEKLSLVDPILAQVVRKQRRVATVDLRAPGTPVIVFK